MTLKLRVAYNHIKSQWSDVGDSESPSPTKMTGDRSRIRN